MGAWRELRSLVAEDARLESVEAGGVAGACATIEAMRFAAAGETSVVDAFELESLGQEAVVVCASIMDAGNVERAPRLPRWLVTGQAGLIWRARIVQSRGDAESMLRVHGIRLGL
jgi:hypothetical protein